MHTFHTAEGYIRQIKVPLAMFPLRVALGAGFHFAILLPLVILLVSLANAIPGPAALLALAGSLVMLFVLGWSLAILSGLGAGACRIVGDDSVLVAALDAGVCDGVVSGVAGVLPEVTAFLFEQRNSAAYARAAELLTELIRHLSVFPVPWGLKIVLECRGITAAWFGQPLSAARTAQADEFRAWFPGWWAHWESAVGAAARP